MPLYLDVHRDVDASVEDVVEAHKKDVETQDKHGVKYLNYWVDEDEGAVFCLFEGPNKRDEKVHREAHGLTADEIFEVEQGEAN
ncbi:DUF4242 domain-containing protein [Halomicroarcula sp. GCM10025710]